MEPVKLSREDQQYCIDQLCSYLRSELDCEIGELAGRLLLDYIAEELGCFFYNKGIEDCQEVLARGTVTIDENLEASKLMASAH